MLNRVILIGRLVRDPELRYTPNGTAVTTWTLAVNRSRKQEGQQEADFINIVAWSKLADLCANYLKKGKQAAVEGRIQSRSYDNKEGKKVYVTEVVAENVQFLGSKDDGNGFDTGFSGESKPASKGNDYDPFADAGKPINISDDDLPF
ncbi:single-stranded DNA-binding protein [Brevibacillus ginsengisoli]|uniref:single-stranded DNA-binding protein n=1 Tax=Brevibacillus ginsengisoli TaxID=363854 RepID=UPI003CE8B1E5